MLLTFFTVQSIFLLIFSVCLLFNFSHLILMLNIYSILAFRWFFFCVFWAAVSSVFFTRFYSMVAICFFFSVPTFNIYVLLSLFGLLFFALLDYFYLMMLLVYYISLKNLRCQLLLLLLLLLWFFLILVCLMLFFKNIQLF